jgi:hypothetical protein
VSKKVFATVDDHLWQLAYQLVRCALTRGETTADLAALCNQPDLFGPVAVRPDRVNVYCPQKTLRRWPGLRQGRAAARERPGHRRSHARNTFHNRPPEERAWIPYLRLSEALWGLGSFSAWPRISPLRLQSCFKADWDGGVLDWSDTPSVSALAGRAGSGTEMIESVPKEIDAARIHLTIHARHSHRGRLLPTHHDHYSPREQAGPVTGGPPGTKITSR